MGIIQLPNKVSRLSPKDKALFNRFYDLHMTSGKLKPTDQMIDWIRKTFGSVNKVKNQQIVNIVNKFTYEGALYNE